MKVIALDTLATSDAVTVVVQAVDADPPEGWTAVKFTSPVELVERLHDLNAEHVEKLEIVSEGSPLHLDGLNYQPATNDINVLAFGEDLRTVAGFSSESIIYLSGCNTGCSQPGVRRDRCIAQTLANAASCRVRGSRGYLTGYHARGDEECVEDLTGYDAARYPWSKDARGDDCWHTFKPKQGR